jgi:hypothetical protein
MANKNVQDLLARSTIARELPGIAREQAPDALTAERLIAHGICDDICEELDAAIVAAGLPSPVDRLGAIVGRVLGL